MNKVDMFTKLTKTTKAAKKVEKPWLVRLCGLQLVVGLSLVALSGCASAQAKGKPADRPALMVPPPPPRAIEPAVEVPLEPVAELPPSSPSPRTRPTAPKPAPGEARPEAKAGDQKPVEPPAVETLTPPASPSTPQLRTPQTADTSGAAKNVRATIDSARALLNTVNYGPLSNERKKAYNDVKLFIQQAEDALKQGNLVFAQGVATKAETLARELAGR